MKNFKHKWLHRSSLFLWLHIFTHASMGAPTLANKFEKINWVVWPLTGKVVDRTGSPLPGVTVLIKGSGVGASTGPDGVFNLNAPETPGTLVFSFVGFTNQEVPFTGPGTYN